VLRLGEGDKLPSLPAVDVGDSDRLEAGHWLIALGDPPGAEKDLAVGVVASAPGRQCYQQEMSATRVQSSLAIADRARGGPVIDIHGRVVGLSVGEPRAADAAGRPSSTASFVLPINLVLNLYEALKVAQSTRSPWIGISVLELERAAARRDAAKPAAALPTSGVAIDDVFTPSPAATAGVRPGDFLLELGGHRVASVGDFQKWMYVLGIGAKVELGLVRDGVPLRVEVTIEARPPSATTS
jgi:serine protease Do